MGPNGFMARTLLALQVLFRNLYFVVKLLVTMHPKNVKLLPDFVAISSQLHLSWMAYHKRTLENHKIGHKKFYWKTEKKNNNINGMPCRKYSRYLHPHEYLVTM